MRGTHTKVVNWLVLQKRYSAITAQAFFCDLELSIPQHIFASSSTLRPLGSCSFCFFCTRPSHPWRGDRGYMVSIGKSILICLKSIFRNWSLAIVIKFLSIFKDGDLWVLLVAGSNGWFNYRHQVFFTFWQQTSSLSKPWCAVRLLNCTGTSSAHCCAIFLCYLGGEIDD